jgi:hypothetical protein
MLSPDIEKYQSPRFAFLALSLALLGASAMLYYHLGLFMPRVLEVSAAKNLAGGYFFGNDFYPVWLTSRECVLQGRDPYSADMTREIQKGLFGRSFPPTLSRITGPSPIRLLRIFCSGPLGSCRFLFCG